MRNTHSLRRTNLIGIGAPRTATSSLASMLSATGQVFVPEEKEINGFGIDVELTESRYNARFSEARTEHCYLADISPVYLSNSRVAERIKRYNPQAKIIATLREPVSRVISQYRHMKRKVDPVLGPELQVDLNSYVQNGLRALRNKRPPENSWYSASMNIAHSLYGRHLRRYFDCFPQHQILVLIYEELICRRPFEEKGKWGEELQLFLGIDVSEKFWHNSAEGPEVKIADDLEADLREMFAAEVAATSQLIGRDLNRIWGY